MHKWLLLNIKALNLHRFQSRGHLWDEYKTKNITNTISIILDSFCFFVWMGCWFLCLLVIFIKYIDYWYRAFISFRHLSALFERNSIYSMSKFDFSLFPYFTLAKWSLWRVLIALHLCHYFGTIRSVFQFPYILMFLKSVLFYTQLWFLNYLSKHFIRERFSFRKVIVLFFLTWTFYFLFNHLVLWFSLIKVISPMILYCFKEMK